ncbi:dihydrodipicolinate synthase family protein [Paenibacillus agaridevorans]|uniref:Dihydrodipicolinate synthase family protein n=1 Tax=Paenibacillus agaridevorans TaxID=171404 RepID=A0A2R5EKZ9_9BACL|nr:dihydrodipicolinate synthase family protein [Paenibacillus agaridevorans]GBG07320.1 dihydrodipicolinate synthase family protein [Paenibacillus agaridevorans]
MKNILSAGYYPALGTPLDEQGNVIASSLSLHVEDQLNGNAAGLLVMGSMGMQAQIKNSEYARTAQIASDAVKAAQSACPVMVGVMDNSIGRVAERIDSLKGMALSGVVATTPFYFALTQTEVRAFFERIASKSPFPVYMYDLPGITKTKIEAATAIELMKHPNIAGIKTGDLALARVLQREKFQHAPNFSVLFSGLDVFDAAYGYGLTSQLDGMFSCTTAINKRLYESLASEDMEAASSSLDDIITLRNTFVSVGVFGGFSYAMNSLGFEGNFAPDYAPRLTAAQEEQVQSCMRSLKLI